MRRSRFLANTLKETPKEAQVISHVLMLRTGMIKQLAAGIYTYMPLALRSLQKIEKIVREELDREECCELLMPFVQPSELWEESGRWQAYGKELLRLKDRKENDFCLGPTHEEVITDIVRKEVRSYKELPLNLYQIQGKFRDEIRPRFGLMRGREFIMKDAYSFDVDEDASNRTYWQMYEAYKRIFERCGLVFRPVEADSGSIGGSFTHEFHVLAGSGEDLILSCNHCDYAANVERCELKSPEPFKPTGSVSAPEEIPTPDKKSIEDVATLLEVSPSQCIKMLVYRSSVGVFGAAVPGDRELNEAALLNAAGGHDLEMVVDAETLNKHHLIPGSISPVNWPKDLPLFVDPQVMAMESAVAGAGRADTHLTGVVPSAHIKATKVVALSEARAGDTCARCGEGTLEAFRGIEVGQVFKLGTKYSEAMKCTYLDAEGKEQTIVMGCYGIGISRTMAAAIEQNHDENGIIWPVQIAPFHVTLLNLDVKDDTVNETVDNLYRQLQSRGVEVFLDDTALRPGPKFKDADLIGIPIQITIGARSLKNGVVDVKIRKTGHKESVALNDACEKILSTLKDLGWNS